jgi:alkyl sulfatase BDS1-like metallo-beta-lactamase superfamily hydrolase
VPTADFNDRADFEAADRGLVGSLVPCVIQSGDGREIWNNDAYRFLTGDCPETVNPGLWRQSQLTARQGLYEVTDGMYQVRGFDLSNMTVVESDHGVWKEAFAIDWQFTDLGHTYRTQLSNGVLIQDEDPSTGAAGLTVTLTKQQFLGVFEGGAGLNGITATGDVSLLQRLLSFLDQPTPMFPIVTP